MSESVSPYSHPFDLLSVRDRELAVTLAPAAAERAAIAQWLEILALPSLTARIAITGKSNDLYACTVRFTAEIVQACVVSLEPCPARLTGEFTRTYRLPARSSRTRRKAPEPVIIDIESDDDDEIQSVESPLLDLAAPLLEELLLALDPYPRAPGAHFEPPSEPAGPQSPFAVLKALKDRH